LRFGEYFGIELRLHWSFLAVAAWIGLTVLSQTGSVLVATSLLISLGSIFACVALHEYGHALMARHYGIETLEITLLPIGGVARLERLPEDPKQELWIALAGPATNFVLAGGLAILHWLVAGSTAGLLPINLFNGSLLSTLFGVNIIMGVFNLLPALPMDGGRVQRALLSLRMPALRATGIATTLARALAAVMIVYGLVEGGLMLALIGGFVWMTARTEYQNAVLMERMKAARSGQGHRTGPGEHPSLDPPNEWVQPQVTKPGRKTFIMRGKDDRAH